MGRADICPMESALRERFDAARSRNADCASLLLLGVVLNCSFERPFHSVFNMLELLRLNVICYLPKLGMYPVIPQHSATNLRIELRNGFGVAESTVIHAKNQKSVFV